MYELLHPDAVLLLGVRAWTSCVGIVCIVYGSFTADRLWDDAETTDPFFDHHDDDDNDDHDNDGMDHGRDNDNNNNTNNETSNNHATTSESLEAATTLALERAYQYMDSVAQAVTNQEATAITATTDPNRVRLVWAGPAGRSLTWAAVGWVLLTLSHVWDGHSLAGGWKITLVGLVQMVVLVGIAVTQTALLTVALHDKQVTHHSYFFTVALFGGYVAYGMLGMLSSSSAAPVWTCPSGALAVALSPHVLWFCRKRGDTYDRAGLANPHPVLYNIGGPLLVFGWLLLWVALNAVDANPQSHWYLPLYWTSRTAVAYEGAVAILAAYWLTGYAQDEHTEERPLKAYVFGRVLEMRLAFTVAFGMLACAVCLPTFATQPWVALPQAAVIVALGLGTGVQHVLGVRAGHAAKLRKWTRVTATLYALLAVGTLVAAGVTAAVLVVAGALLIVTGWRRLYVDRQRGEHWVETKRAPNPHFTVYSYGVLIFPAGLCLLAWGLSIP